jgi:hypothetical protein
VGSGPIWLPAAERLCRALTAEVAAAPEIHRCRLALLALPADRCLGSLGVADAIDRALALASVAEEIDDPWTAAAHRLDAADALAVTSLDDWEHRRARSSPARAALISTSGLVLGAAGSLPASVAAWVGAVGEVRDALEAEIAAHARTLASSDPEWRSERFVDGPRRFRWRSPFAEPGRTRLADAVAPLLARAATGASPPPAVPRADPELVVSVERWIAAPPLLGGPWPDDPALIGPMEHRAATIEAGDPLAAVLAALRRIVDARAERLALWPEPLVAALVERAGAALDQVRTTLDAEVAWTRHTAEERVEDAWARALAVLLHAPIQRRLEDLVITDPADRVIGTIEAASSAAVEFIGPAWVTAPWLADHLRIFTSCAAAGEVPPGAEVGEVGHPTARAATVVEAVGAALGRPLVPEGLDAFVARLVDLDGPRPRCVLWDCEVGIDPAAWRALRRTPPPGADVER